MAKKRFIPGICAALILLTAAAAQAQYFSFSSLKLLSDEALSELRPEAAEFYLQGVDKLNHVDIDGGIDAMEKALEADPDSVDLAFLTAELARKRARVTHGARARRYFELATNAYNIILSRDDIDQDVATRDRAQIMNRMTRDEMDNLDLRELKRQERGLNVSLAIADEYDLPLKETIDGDNNNIADLDPTRPFHLQAVDGELPALAAAPAPAPQPAGANIFGAPPGEFGGGGFGQPGGGFGQPGGGFGQPGGGFGQPGGGFGQQGGFGQPGGGFGQQGGGFGQQGGGFGQPGAGNPFAPAPQQGGGYTQQVPGGGTVAF